MKRLWQLMLRTAGSQAGQFTRAIAGSTFASLAAAAGYATLIGLIAELASDHPDATRAWIWFAAFVVCYLAEVAGRLIELNFEYSSWARTMYDIRVALGNSLRTMPLRVLERRSAGDMAAVVGGDVTNASMSVSQIAFQFMAAATVPTVLAIVILIVDWRIGVVLLIAILAAVPLVRRIQHTAAANYDDGGEADARTAARIVEYVQGQPVFRATGQVGAASSRLDEALRAQTEVMIRGQRALTMPSILAGTVVQLGIVVAVAVGALAVFDGSMSAALLAALVLAAVKLSEPLVNASSMIAIFEIAEAAMRRIAVVVDVAPLPVRGRGRITPGDITFDEVSFSYDGSADALDHVSLAVPPNSMTALVGPSGSGKSTIAALITRYDDPQSGSIRIGGTDLREVDPAEIYRHVAVVFQDVYLFDDTIGANIAMGKPGATQTEIEAAATAAGVHDFVRELPRGYDTPVGEIGSALSGGERQRVSIARAILKDAPVVILDEPTAALDAHSEVLVQRAIDALVKNRTVIVIAHRLTTIAAADQILVVDAGRVAQRGRHEELLERPGRYRDMWQAQRRSREWRIATTHGPNDRDPERLGSL